MGMGGIGGALPSWQWVIKNGKLIDAETWHRDNAKAIEEFKNPPPMQELYVELPKGYDGSGAETAPLRDLSQVGEMDPTTLKAPEGYNSFLDYLEDWSLEHFHDHTVAPSHSEDQIRLSMTSIYDYVMWDEADGMNAEDWYAEKSSQDIGYQIKRAQTMTNRKNRGIEVDDADLLVRIGSRKFTLDEMHALQSELNKAKDLIDAVSGMTSSFVRQQRPNSPDAANWTLGTYEGFHLLAVKKALSRSDISSEVANTLYERAVQGTIRSHEQNYDIECQIADRTGGLRAGFREKYDYSCGTHSLYDKNAFMSDVFWKMIDIDVSTDESLRQGFGDFADWYANGIQQAFRGDPWYDGKTMAAEYKDSLYYLKSLCGL